MKNILKKLVHDGILIFIGMIIMGSVGVVVAENIASSTVDYNKNSQATVEDALDDLYSKSENCSANPYADKGSLAEHILSLYETDGINNLYYHDKVGTYATYEAGDYSYRFSGPTASVENYVCFGSDAQVCGSSLYRIIGAFKENYTDKYQLKLIKATAADSSMLGTNGAYSSATTYKWHTSRDNTWSSAVLNTTNLNTNYVNYLNNIDSKWMGYIDTHTWTVAGNTWTLIAQTAGAQNVYAKEITTPSANTTYSDEIGLMYVSDYMYGASPTYWNKMGYNSSASNDMRAAISANWLYSGTTEWTIARQSDGSDIAFYVNSSGNVVHNYVNDGGYGVRPVFYLKSDVSYIGGSGTSGDPYRIS